MSGQDLIVTPTVVIPAHELVEQVSTSGGPGGQHANKSSTRVILRWSVTKSAAIREWQRERLLERLANRLNKDGELIIQADENRSQRMNRESARARLVSILVTGLERKKVRRKTKPSNAAKKRRVDAKKKRGETKRGRKKVQRPMD